MFSDPRIDEAMKNIGAVKVLPKYTDVEMKLRELLWLNHGCPVHILYGDDGEMQCGRCLIDFKRHDVKFIEERFQNRIRMAMNEHQT